MIKRFCDRCEIEITGDRMNTGDIKYQYIGPSYSTYTKYMELCPNCSKEFKELFEKFKGKRNES